MKRQSPPTGKPARADGAAPSKKPGKKHGSQQRSAPLGRLDSLARSWSSARSCILLAVVTLACLAPLTGTAFQMDEPLFVWAARQIASHPLNPYGFNVVWYMAEMPMSEVTKNPPLSSYYAALAGILGGWSERVLHLAFLLPALGLILGTYFLARRFTRTPLLAAAATLLTPAFMVSAGTVTSDTMMLALWVLAAILWMKGLEPVKPLHLTASGLLIAAAALTKYFGASLIVLLLIFSLVRQRRLGAWAWYLLVPIISLAGYQFWTAAHYGRGLLLDAAAYASTEQGAEGISTLAKGLVGIAFAGGCMLPGLTFASLLWRRKGILAGIILSALAALAVGTGWIDSGAPVPQEHRTLIGVQLALWIAAGGSVLALAVADLRRRTDAESLFLALWVFGTMLFAGFLNWTVNGRSILPLIPAAGILLARRLDAASSRFRLRLAAKLAAPLAASGLFSVWVAWANADLANSAPKAVALIHEKTRKESGAVRFQGHWGFQYYMEAIGARPLDFNRNDLHAGDILVIPENNTNTADLKPDLVASEETIEVNLRPWLSTMKPELGAGFYAYDWGPLPFAFGHVPPERYHLLRLAPLKDTSRGD